MGKQPLWRRLAASAGSLDADELSDEVAACGGQKCSYLKPGNVVTVAGRLRHVVFTPSESVPIVEAELYDGSGTVELVWLGRRQIVGIEPGRSVSVVGRVGQHDGKLTIYNPRYELRAPA